MAEKSDDNRYSKSPIHFKFLSYNIEWSSEKPCKDQTELSKARFGWSGVPVSSNNYIWLVMF